jgi:tetratricopeptide (TPR) repeat protein
MRFTHKHFAGGAFIASLLVSAYLAGPAPAAAAVSIACGLVLAFVLLFLPVIEGRIAAGGSVKIGPTGLDLGPLPWRARKDRPLLTIIPENPSDSTANPQAREICQRGRDLVSRRAAGEVVDIEAAVGYFREALVLDPDYWEAQINLAQTMLIKGRLHEAMSLASDVRIRRSDNPLAYAKANLILAKVLEQRLQPDQAEESTRKEYHRIVEILRESLQRLPEHMSTRISLGHALFRSAAGQQEMEAFLRESLRYREFKKQFAWLLKEEQLLSRFENRFPGFLENDSQGGDDNG